MEDSDDPLLAFIDEHASKLLERGQEVRYGVVKQQKTFTFVPEISGSSQAVAFLRPGADRGSETVNR